MRLFFVFGLLFSIGQCPRALADGGFLRFSKEIDGRHISVFTTPTPLRVGLADIIVLVQEGVSGTPLSTVPIVIHVYPIHDFLRSISAEATAAAATNKLMRAAQLQFSQPGFWHMEVIVKDNGTTSKIDFDFEVAEALPPWLDLLPWIAWPLGVIILYALWQFLVPRRRRI